MIKINNTSDIKFRIYFRELGNKPLPRFEFRYFTTDKQNYISATFDGTKYTNCQPTESGVIAYWKCPNLYPGRLKVVRKFTEPNSNFSDNEYQFTQAQLTNFEITDHHEQAIDTDSDIVEELISVTGATGKSAYEYAVSAGYSGSESQFATSMISKADRSYVDEKLAVKANTITYSPTSEQAVQGEFFFDLEGVKRNVYVRSLITTMPSAISSYRMVGVGAVAVLSYCVTLYTNESPLRYISSALPNDYAVCDDGYGNLCVSALSLKYAGKRMIITVKYAR